MLILQRLFRSLPSVGETSSFFRIGYFLAGAALAQGAAAADSDSPLAWNDGDVLMLQVGPKTIHFSDGKDRRGEPWLVGAEWQKPSRWLGGYSYFNNSFDQKCHYIYVGRTWQIMEDRPAWYFKLTGGVILGYKEPFENKIPLNHNGVAPGLIPGVGYKFDHFNAQVNLLGTAGLMFTIGYDFVR